MKFLKSLSVVATLLALSVSPTLAEGLVKEANDIPFSFEGPFGKFDIGQLQRGYKVYKEVCSNCHAMSLVSFRNLDESGIFSEEQVKALAATFTVKDGPNSDGDMFDRPGSRSDRFPSPYPNDEASKASNGGALPPDLSLITKARAGWHGTWRQLANGMGGPEYIVSLLTGYEEPDEEHKKDQPEGKHFNPYFQAGPWIGMGAPLADGLVTFDDGAPNTVNDMARDVAAFLAWTAEPKMQERKELGLKVMLYLLALAGLLYFTKQKVWRNVEH